jgi:hypothetical protein
MSKKKNGNKIMTYLSAITISGALLLMLLSLYWMVYPYKTVQMEDFKTDQQQYHPGDTISYSFEYTKWSNLPAIVSRQLVDTVSYNIDSFIPGLPVGGPRSAANSVIIPTYVKPGIYTLHTRYSIRMNPLRVIVRESVSNEFMVGSP